MADPNENKIETEEDITLPQGDGITVAGIFGDSDVRSMSDRERRIADFKKRYNYQEICPCVACCNCIEFRGFNAQGEAYTIGWYCLLAEMSITPFGTCLSSHPRRNNRRRVIYDRRNAPPGFEEGLAPVTMRRCFSRKERFHALREESRGYRGGSSSYQRKDGDVEAVGTGKIPKGLGN